MIIEDFVLTKERIDDAKIVFDNTKSKPEIEQTLFKLQEEWLLDRDNIIKYNKFYLEMLPYCKSIILQKIKGGSYIHEDDVVLILDDVMARFFKLYSRDKSYVVGTSFYGALRFKVQEALSQYYNNKKNNEISLDDEVNVSGNSSFKKSTLLDLLSENEYTNNFEKSLYSFNDYITDLIKGYSDELYGITNYDSALYTYKLIIYILIMMKNSNSSKNKYNYNKIINLADKLIQMFFKTSNMSYMAYQGAEKAFLHIIKKLENNLCYR